jgi:hypothetical protein
MRNVTFALQKEISGRKELGEWYEKWQQQLKADRRLKWAVAARNHVVKRGDLAVNSTALAWIAGDRITSKPVEIRVSPTASAVEIARSLRLPALEDVVRREGVLVVERRWVVDDFPDQELLDLLAHNFARLAELVADAHTQRGVSMRTCEKTLDDPCGGSEVLSSGRLGCMSVSEILRTSRVNLSDGAPIKIGVQKLHQPPIAELDDSTLRQRYPKVDLDPQRTTNLFDEAERLHRIARAMMEADGEHITIAWLMRDGQVLSQLVLVAHDQRELYLTMESLAAEARQLGADQLIVNAEGWEARRLAPDNPRYVLRPEDREDRREVLLTHALQRAGRTAHGALLSPGATKARRSSEKHRPATRCHIASNRSSKSGTAGLQPAKRLRRLTRDSPRRSRAHRSCCLGR